MRPSRALCLLAAACPLAQAGQALENRPPYYRIKIPADPGSATVLVRNTHDHAATIDRLLMDGSPLPAHGISHRRRRCANKGLRWPRDFFCEFPDFFRDDRVISQTYI